MPWKVAIFLPSTLAGTGRWEVDATPPPPPPVFLEYLFCLPVECHRFFYSLPTTFLHRPENVKTLTTPLAFDP